MKKTVVAIAAGLIIAGSGSTQAFAAEYKVQDGDSLWKISNENNVSIKQLKEDNNLSSDIIFPNQTLQVNSSEKNPLLITILNTQLLQEIPLDISPLIMV